MTVFNLIDTDARRKAGHALTITERINSVIQSINDAGIRRKAICELEALSDAQLDDIGIPRYAIREMVEAKSKNVAEQSDSTKSAGEENRRYEPCLVSKAEFVT